MIDERNSHESVSAEGRCEVNPGYISGAGGGIINTVLYAKYTTEEWNSLTELPTLEKELEALSNHGV